MNPQTLSLGTYQNAFAREVRVWREENRVRRLWEKNASLWTGTDEAPLHVHLGPDVPSELRALRLLTS